MATVSIHKVANRLEYGALHRGGATLGAVSLITPVSGYVVALPSFGTVLDHLNPFDSPTDRWLLNSTIRTWVELRRAELAWPGRYAGSWVSGTTIFLDVVEIHTDRDTALDLARQRGELAIWHLDTATEIFVAPDGERAA